MPNIDSFKKSIASGLARGNKWRVFINFPTFAGSNADEQQATLLARTTNTPSSTLGVIEVGWGGRILPIPGDRTYEEFTLNFIGVNDFNVRNAFERWSENINGSQSNTGLISPDQYMTDIVLQLLDYNDNVTKEYILHDAWPSVVGQIALDAGAQDSFAEFETTFRFLSYESNTTR